MFILIGIKFVVLLRGKNTKYVLMCSPRWSNCTISLLFKRRNEEKYQNMPISCWPEEAIC